jgi:RNase adapter protein RapZ
MSKPNRVVIVSGMSGAGKTNAMGVLEDLGYHCMDQYPLALLPHLIELVASQQDERYQNLALSTTLGEFKAFVSTLEPLDWDLRILLLEASPAELLRRYKFTRRTHPMLLSKKASTLEEGIRIERELLNAHKEVYRFSVDTTHLNVNELKRKLRQVLAISQKASFSISFISFGYKQGIPLDADLIFDVRFLPNPYWSKALRPLTGNDQAVYDYVMDSKETQRFIKKLNAFLEYAFKQYDKEGKNHFTVAIGCTGGQHRSVSLVNYLQNHYSDKYVCYKDHRDIE